MKKQKQNPARPQPGERIASVTAGRDRILGDPTATFWYACGQDRSLFDGITMLVFGDLAQALGKRLDGGTDNALMAARLMFATEGQEHSRIWQFVQAAYWRHHHPDHPVAAQVNAQMLALEVADWLADEAGMKQDMPDWNPLDDLKQLYGCTEEQAGMILAAARMLLALPPVKPKSVKDQATASVTPGRDRNA